MDFFSGSESRNFISFHLGEEMSGQPTQENPEEMETNPSSSTPQAIIKETQVTEDLEATNERLSASDSESCGTYFTRKVESLGVIEAATYETSGELCAQSKTSVIDLVSITPGLNLLLQEPETVDTTPQVIFLDDPRPSSGSLGATNTDAGQMAESGSECLETDTASASRGLMDYRSHTDDDSRHDMDLETVSQARSTLADALHSPAKTTAIVCPGGSSNESSDIIAPVELGPTPLSGTSRAIVKHCFEEVSPICLDPGHPVVAFNQDQITSILRIVGDESARASFEMLNSIVERASKLNLGSSKPTTSRARPRSSSGPETDTDISCGSVTTYCPRELDSSPGITSDAESRQDLRSSISLPSPPVFVGPGHPDPTSDQGSPIGSSPGNQTLATVRKEAIKEKRQTGKSVSQRTKSRGSPKPRRRIGRIMREEYFDTMPWTRTFVSFPVDPRWNRQKIYRQICKCNVSIRSKGPKEIQRHYATERHLRKDQRWRYEYLTIEDPLTKRPRYQVRGRDGKILTNYQLQLELPHFIDCEVVDIGDKLPFYEEAMAGSNYMSSSPQNLAKIQISILGHFLPLSGDIHVLRTLCQQIGVVVNHQALFSDVDWSTARLSVSSLVWMDRLVV